MISRGAEAGQTVAPTGPPLLVISEDSLREIEAATTPEMIEKISVHGEASIEAGQRSARRLNARVTRIEKARNIIILAVEDDKGV
ncbi:hypothetical protein NL529_29200, partial [Klebsiella pneumoniae]|nr:hypothetical protein [Klebsiella pneumoniae]